MRSIYSYKEKKTKYVRILFRCVPRDDEHNYIDIDIGTSSPHKQFMNDTFQDAIYWPGGKMCRIFICCK